MKLWMKHPSSWPRELWRESLPMGNGKTSALLCGSAGIEHLWLNRFDRWEGGYDGILPNVQESLNETRKLIREKRYAEANSNLANKLSAHGYQVNLASPMAPIEITVRFESTKPSRHYRRGIDLATGEVFVHYEQGLNKIMRRAFVSRESDQLVMEFCASLPLSFKIDKPNDKHLHIRIQAQAQSCITDKGSYYHVTDALLVTLWARFDDLPICESYDTLIQKHIPLFEKALGEAELFLSNDDHSIEELLEATHNNNIPLELCDKLWHFGRVLFASGTCKDGAPFPLYGLWNGERNAPWSQHVANENVEMIYWHANAGGLAHLVKPLIHYYFLKMDAFRESAQKLFGCKGIFVSTYTTPENSNPSPNVPVIVNYISCAGWLCRHFYDYYRYTGDEETLNNEILPFMLETAAFYEDYAVYDADGHMRLIPSVSPENSPANFIPENFNDNMGHINPVVWNSTMDFAILKELLVNLLTLCKSHPSVSMRGDVWLHMLHSIPEYMVNDNGALKEWMDDDLSDFYKHRHLSHVYPLFPGDEIDSEHKLFSACEKAVDLRELGFASGWSLMHQSAIYARLGRGDAALECLHTMANSCLLSNLFTLHNDWRDMGFTLSIPMEPVQLDALMGAVNAIQEMLLRAVPGKLFILPACPTRFRTGKVHAWRFPGGSISFEWDQDLKHLSMELIADREGEWDIILPRWITTFKTHVTLHACDIITLNF